MSARVWLSTHRLMLRAGSRTLVSALDWEVSAGERWCVLGPNGSGKTTLLHALAGLRRTDGGEVRWQGRNCADWAPDAAARFRGLLPQHVHDPFPARSIDVVLLGRHPHRGNDLWEDEADRLAADAALLAVDAQALALRDVTTLSGGERRRVAIATLLAQQTPLLLLDEPNAHLDLKHQALLLRHLRSVVDDEHAAVLTLHDLDLAARWATHALLLDGRGNVTHGPVHAVMDDAALSHAFGVSVQRASLDGRLHFAIE